MSDDNSFVMVDPQWAMRELESRAKYEFRNRDLALVALTHASGAITRDVSNERLEFLGDAVLGFSTCEYLFSRFPQWQEGELTQLKSMVVSRKTCAEWARQLDLEVLLIVGKGVGTLGKLPSSLLANAFESIIAAIYLDGGLDAANQFLRPLIAEKVDAACEEAIEQNYKSALQQLVQKDLGRPPSYVVIEESGPDHDKSFCVAVQIGSRRFESAWGKNKKQAEQRAAGHALEELAQPHRGDSTNSQLQTDSD
jgi:ribonuclease-3